MVPLIDFVLSHLPPQPARVLDVGCGEGELARALAVEGYDVTAIDPGAPEGPIFRRIRLEDLEEDEQFDAVVAERSLHAMANVDQNVERVAAALPGAGPLVVEELAWDRIDEPTAQWYEGQRRILRAAGHEPRGPAAGEWESHHAGVVRTEELLATLRRSFAQRHFEWVPYLWRYLGGVASLELEQTLLGAGAIRPLGFRFVGIPHLAAALE